MMKSTCFRSLEQTGTVPAVQETVILYTKLCLMILISVRTWWGVCCARAGGPSQSFLVVEGFWKMYSPDFEFCPGKLTNGGFPQFSLLFFVLFNSVKTDTKLTLYHMGRVLLFNLSGWDLKYGGLHF